MGVQYVAPPPTDLGVDPSGSFATVKDRLNAGRRTIVNPAAGSILALPGVAAGAGNVLSAVFDRDYYFPIAPEDYITFDRVQVEVTSASGTPSTVGRIAIYAADASWQPSGNPIEDFGTFASDSLGVKTITPSGGSRTLAGGRYLLAVNVATANTGLRVLTGSVSPGAVAAMGTSIQAAQLYVARANATFPSPGTAWTTIVASSSGYFNCVFLRVTAVG